jgi:hypothetical protein
MGKDGFMKKLLIIGCLMAISLIFTFTNNVFAAGTNSSDFMINTSLDDELPCENNDPLVEFNAFLVIVRDADGIDITLNEEYLDVPVDKTYARGANIYPDPTGDVIRVTFTSDDSLSGYVFSSGQQWFQGGISITSDADDAESMDSLSINGIRIPEGGDMILVNEFEYDERGWAETTNVFVYKVEILETGDGVALDTTIMIHVTETVKCYEQLCNF